MIAARVLVVGPVSETPLVEELVGALREGFGEAAGRFEIEYRGFTEDYHDPLLNVASEIDSLRPAVVVVWGAQCARYEGYAHRPPVVVIINGDPVALNVLVSRRRSGFTTWAPDLVRAQVAILKELVPHARRVAVLWDPSDGGSVRAFNDSAEPSRSLGLRRESLEARRPHEFESVLATAVERDVDAVCILSSPLSVAHAARIARLAETHRLPLLGDLGEFAQAGALAAYGGSLRTTFRRAASHVKRILAGARSEDIGMERLTSPELVINVRAAQSLGLAIPPSLLARAHRLLD